MLYIVFLKVSEKGGRFEAGSARCFKLAVQWRSMATAAFGVLEAAAQATNMGAPTKHSYCSFRFGFEDSGTLPAWRSTAVPFCHVPRGVYCSLSMFFV